MPAAGWGVEIRACLEELRFALEKDEERQARVRQRSWVAAGRNTTGMARRKRRHELSPGDAVDVGSWVRNGRIRPSGNVGGSSWSRAMPSVFAVAFRSSLARLFISTTATTGLAIWV